MGNLFTFPTASFDQEIFETLLQHDGVRIERILSRGHTSPEHGWYDQDENEWVVVLRGNGTIHFAGGGQVTLGEGDYLNIPAHCKHKVVWTDPEEITVWLAVFTPAAEDPDAPGSAAK